MSIRLSKPYTPARRQMSFIDRSGLSKDKPPRSLRESLQKHGGRNNAGLVSVRHQGGESRKYYRIIDFKRDKFDIPGKVATIEYDPNRTAFISLINYVDGEKRYIICPVNLNVGDKVMSGEKADISAGNAMKLKHLPVGVMVHNIELVPGGGGKIARSAGCVAQLIGKENDTAVLRMPSGEMRRVRIECMATIGQVSNIDNENVSIGSAGRSRKMGIRPTVRGTAMNSVDHPHGGGRGRSKGNNQPRSPWNQPAKGFKTRDKHKYSDSAIIKRRK